MVHSSGQALTDILKRWVSAADKSISDPDAKEILIETMIFQNSNTKCKRVIRLLKAQAAQIDMSIKDMNNISSHKHHTTIIGQATAWGLGY